MPSGNRGEKNEASSPAPFDMKSMHRFVGLAEPVLDRVASCARVCLLALGIWSFFQAVLPLAEKNQWEEKVSAAILDIEERTKDQQSQQTALKIVDVDLLEQQENLLDLERQIDSVRASERQFNYRTARALSSAGHDYGVTKRLAIERVLVGNFHCTDSLSRGWPDGEQLSLDLTHWDNCLAELSRRARDGLSELEPSDKKNFLKEFALSTALHRPEFLALAETMRSRVARAYAALEELRGLSNPIDSKAFHAAQQELADSHSDPPEQLSGLIRAVAWKAAEKSLRVSHVLDK